MSLVLGHRGYSSKHLENSQEAFSAALKAGMDGFELDVQLTRDGVCVIMHDADVLRTSKGTGMVAKLKYAELPLLKNGEPIPRLSEALDLSAKLINVELKGERVWKQALAAVEASEALDRVLFSSFEHSEILQLWSACPEARCGFLWEADEAMRVTEEELSDLPPNLFVHVPVIAVRANPELWQPHAARLALWGLDAAKDGLNLPFEPAILIADRP